jgi:hypothetical protein
MQSWIEIVTDPHHIFADFLMNVGFEIAFAWVTYLILVKALRQSRRKSLEEEELKEGLIQLEDEQPKW